MPLTQIADVIEPEIFSGYVRLATTEKSALLSSSVVTSGPEFNALASGGGSSIHLPFWDAMGAPEPNVGSDDPAQTSTPNKIAAGNQRAVMHYLNQSWSAANLSMAIAGDDPMRAIGDQVAGYWARAFQHKLIASLNGVLADNIANHGGDMVYDVSSDAPGEPTAAERIGPSPLIRARLTMGDAADSLTAIAMHSVVLGRLQEQEAIEYLRPAGTSIRIPTYLGHTVIVDDGLPVEPGVTNPDRDSYISILFGAGAVAMGEGSPRRPTETQEAPDQGNGEGVETLYNRRHIFLHPRGYKFTEASMAGQSPTNVELADATNWTRVFNRKSTSFAFLKTNG